GSATTGDAFSQDAAAARCSPFPSRTRASRAAASSSSASRSRRRSPTTIWSSHAISGTPPAARSSGAACSRPSGRRARSRSAWREEEVEALLALAANTSAALSNAELYQRVALEKERSFAILANIADGIVAVDRDAEVVLWNRAAEQITGVPQEEALGRTPVQV